MVLLCTKFLCINTGIKGGCGTMCGIVGFIGEQPAAPILLEGLSKLEYRGYDSAGIAVFEEEGIKVVTTGAGSPEKYMEAWKAAGVKVMVTEWDMSALPTARMGANISDTVSYKQSLNPYPDGLPDSVSVAWNNQMKEFFGLFLKHSNIITRVTAWGVTDGDSWKNNFPVPGRVDYPLLFDRDCRPKPFVEELIGKQNI